MELYTPGTLRLPASVLTVGALDGIHKGHQKLLSKAKERAEKLGVPFVVYTFNPPPKVYFKRCHMLTSLEEKLQRLEAMGAEYIVVSDFNEEFIKKEAADFIEEIAMVNPLEVWEGPDFHFGKNRAGDNELLQQYFEVGVVPSMKCEEGEIISSTRIRGLLKEKKYFQAKKLLGEEVFASSIIGTDHQKVSAVV